MLVTANGVRVVGKELQNWKDGTHTCRVTVSSEDGGGMLTVDCEDEFYTSCAMFDVKYDMEIDIYNAANYKTGKLLVSASEQ